MTTVLVWLVAIGIGLGPMTVQARSAGTSGAHTVAQSGTTTIKKLPGKRKPPTVTLKRGVTNY
jgi:hypothetical protein